MLADGHGPGAVQKQANIEYRLLDDAEKESLNKKAEEQNSGDPSDSRIPRQQLIKKLVANIDSNVSTHS